MSLAVTLAADDQREITELSYRYAAGIDHRDWMLYRSIFADVCTIDFSSWSGRPAADMAADDWVDAVRSVNGNFDATQHIMTNHRFEPLTRTAGTGTGPAGDIVVGTNELQAQHWFRGSSMASFGRPELDAWCLLGGHYTNTYVRTADGWKISECGLTVRWRTGDESIFTFARHRTR